MIQEKPDVLTRERLKELYQPPTKEFTVVDVPDLRYFMIDGEGDPAGEAYADAMKWLFTVIHPIRREAKQRMGKQFVEPPLESLFWADDMDDFIAGRRDQLKWRAMIVAAEWIDRAMFDQAVSHAGERLGNAPETLRLEPYREGRSVQIMYVGSPSEATAVMSRLHDEFLPARKLVPSGHHHEIYLNDPRRVAPDKRRIVFRQPVRTCDAEA